MSTLLNGVNDVLRKVHIVQGDSGVLTSLTDSARQGFIDVAVQSWNEMIDDLYSRSAFEKPRIWTSNTITLVTDTRVYDLQSDVIELHWPFHNVTTGTYIREYPGGYLKLVRSQDIPANFTGLPNWGALDPTHTATRIYLDRIPTASENGQAFTYYYQKDSGLSLAADAMPFNEGVYRALIPAVAEIWRRYQHKDFDEAIFNTSYGRAARFLGQKKQNHSWLPPRYIINETDPFHG